MELPRGAGRALPARVGAVDGGALEDGEGVGERVGEDGEGGSEGAGVLGAREGDGEEVGGLREVRVEGFEGVDVDGVVWREGEVLGGDGSKLEVECLVA